MHPTASALLAAHRAHLLNQLSGENLNITLSREINAYLDWSQTRPINALVKLEDIQRVAQQYVLEQAPTPELQAQILHLVKAAINSPINDKTYIHQLIEHKDYLAIVDKNVG